LVCLHILYIVQASCFQHMRSCCFAIKCRYGMYVLFNTIFLTYLKKGMIIVY